MVFKFCNHYKINWYGSIPVWYRFQNHLIWFHPSVVHVSVYKLIDVRIALQRTQWHGSMIHRFYTSLVQRHLVNNSILFIDMVLYQCGTSSIQHRRFQWPFNNTLIWFSKFVITIKLLDMVLSQCGKQFKTFPWYGSVTTSGLGWGWGPRRGRRTVGGIIFHHIGGVTRKRQGWPMLSHYRLRGERLVN